LNTFARIMGRRNAKDVKTLKAAIANLEEAGGGGGVTEAQVKTIMAPLVNPVTAGLTITAPAGSLEVGEALTSVGFSWTIGNHGSAKSAKIRDTSANADIETLTLAASGTHTETVNITKSTPSTQKYRLDVIDNLDRIISSTVRTINWYYPVFHGSSAKASGLTEAEIEAFAKTLKASAAGTYNYGAVANTYKWLFVPESFTPTSFKSGGFDMPMQSPITITITNEFGVSLSLKGYRTTNSTSGAIDLVVS